MYPRNTMIKNAYFHRARDVCVDVYIAALAILSYVMKKKGFETTRQGRESFFPAIDPIVRDGNNCRPIVAVNSDNP
jgi:hypothetical protein